jgi:hypothetical protein
LSAATILVWELFEMKKTSSIVLMGVLFSTFPTITAAFSFMFIADGHMLAFLMAIVAVFLTRKYRLGCIPGMILMCLSIGTYQAELSVAVILVLLLVIKDLLIDNNDLAAIFKRNWTQGIMVVGGLAFYSLATKVINEIYDVELSSYQGINNTRILALSELINNIRRIKGGFVSFLGVDALPHGDLYGYMNFLVLLIIFILTVVLVMRNKIYKRPISLLVLLACYVAIPLACFIVLFVSVEVQYTITMLMGISFVYVLLLLLMENAKIQFPERRKINKIIEWIPIVVIVYISYHHILNANIAYFYMDLSYERTYSTCANLLSRIDELDKPENAKVAIIGTYASEGVSYMDDMEPYISGVTVDTFLYYDYHYFSMWEYYFGRSFPSASEEEIQEIKQTEEYQNMGRYPDDTGIQVIGDYIVIKMTMD